MHGSSEATSDRNCCSDSDIEAQRTHDPSHPCILSAMTTPGWARKDQDYAWSGADGAAPEPVLPGQLAERPQRVDGAGGRRPDGGAQEEGDEARGPVRLDGL